MSLTNLTIQPTINDDMKSTQALHLILLRVIGDINKGKKAPLSLSKDDILCLNGRLCVPKDEDIWMQILYEAHKIPYFVNPIVTKMYQGLKEHFLWNIMKMDVE